MKRKLLFSGILIAGMAGSVFAQEAPDAAAVQKIRDEGLNHSKVMETAFYLTDVSGPRLANSPGLKRAQNWAVSQLKSWGLEMPSWSPGASLAKAGKCRRITLP